VRDDAAFEADAIFGEAERAIAAIVSDDAACAIPAGEDQRTLDAARNRARTRLAQEDWEDARDALAGREVWITRVVELGARVAHERQSRVEQRQTLMALAREAAARLPAGSVEVVVSREDADLLDRDWRAALLPAADPDSVRVTAGDIDGGCIVRSADGRASFDNTFTARTERLQTVWRGALADLYERATAGIAVRPTAPSEPQ
jgi:vacuolar-type H+-ATPase subunit E/Vma4